ncbi:MAG: hypothetical protein GTO24_26850 [candidate division Zixibacteria bacterium]|nr:hypothetical protein [candidate division Zixibacteria bacterium]
MTHNRISPIFPTSKSELLSLPYLVAPSPDAGENLLKEGIPAGKINRVGDIMVDSLLFHLEEAKRSDIFARLGLLKDQANSASFISSFSPNTIIPYALLTLHRPSNGDEPQFLQKIPTALEEIAPKIPVVFPTHPRTIKQLVLFGLEDKIISHDFGPEAELSFPGIHGLDPLGCLDFLSLMISARFVLTYSGGIQEETTIVGIPCLTLRDTTERPITITESTNVLVWNDTGDIVKEAFKILDGKTKKAKIPAYRDRKIAKRIIKILVEKHVKRTTNLKERYYKQFRENPLR